MGAAIGWAGMGRPDFSQCAKLFYRLPAELREGLNRSEEKVLIWTLFLTWWQSAHSGRSTALASFSETWLGMKIGRSRWTIVRALAKLEGYSLVKRIRRTPKKDGTFQTNLIALSAKLSACLASTTRQVPEKSPCSKSAPQRVENDYKRDKAASFESPPLVPRQGEGNCLATAKTLFGKWLETTPPEFTTGAGNFAKSIRKAMQRS